MLAEEVVEGLEKSAGLRIVEETIYLFESLVNYMWVSEVVVCKEVELVEEVSDVDA